MIAIDLETHLIKPGELQPKPVIASVAAPQGTGLHMPADLAARLPELLKEDCIVGANWAFDAGVLAKHYDLTSLIFQAYADGRFADVQIRQKLVDISQGCHNRARRDGTSGYSLADLELHHLGRSRHDAKDDPDSWRYRYSELEGVPLDKWPEAARQYALEDAEGTLRVYEKQGAGLPSEAEQTRQAWALHLMSCRGLVTDPAAVAALETRLKFSRAANHGALQATGFLKPVALTAQERREGREAEFYTPGKKGPKAMRWGKDMAAIRLAVEKAFLFRGIDPPLTETGLISTDVDALERSQNPELAVLAGVSETEKLLNTYIPMLQKGALVPIQPRFNILVNNGRTSSQGPNIQNLPRAPGVRECFVPRPGYYFSSVDLDGGELRSLAQVQLWLFGRSKLAREIKAGVDPLLSFAAKLLGIGYEEAKRRKSEPKVKETRQFAKIPMYGAPGGLGVDSLVDYARTNYGVFLTAAQAQKLRADWLEAYPEMRLYFDYVSKLVGEGDAVIKSFGSGMVRGGAGYTDTCNHFFSNLIAQGAKEACFRVARECYVDQGTALYGCYPIAFLHDEILMEVPVDRGHEAGYRLAEIMCAAVQEYIPDIPITASPALMSRWIKNAEPKFDERGRLIPWA
jgi:DNA polymerase-1